MSDSNDKQNTFPMPVILAVVAIVILIIIAIFAFGSGDSDTPEETTDETTDQTGSEDTDGSTGEADSAGQAQAGEETTMDLDETAVTPTEEDDETPVNDPETATPTEPSPLPSNWNSLSSAEKIELNPYNCWTGSIVRADNGQCSIGGGSSAGYFLIGMKGQQHHIPFDQISVGLNVAVPTNSTTAQIGEVLENLKASITRPDAFHIVHIYNYSDVHYDASANPQNNYIGLNWVATGEPREIHEFALTNIRYKALGFVPHLETNRDGTALDDNCIAVDISFVILSDVTAQEVVNYYADKGPALRTTLELYYTPEEDEATSEYNYDVLITLYKGDDPALNINDYSEADLFEDLPLIPLNGCGNPGLF